ncbi:hypothetical protein RQM47_01375 [Rubrivirga sp. S365]|uniref:DUF5723 domain-containing protein n=1 Tax=Rubrivirga litoralis TaxID=3075598 RepID=A0ABU3BRW1_9BACT|nr:MULTISPECIES: hypothetical protein [unclassified Rubrivirga]MDT0632021.1 hypothetical protein [Rubrivirga sp. F394]MDT7855286.1 hypothetical protein [Rubrivirga sp. S365]
MPTLPALRLRPLLALTLALAAGSVAAQPFGALSQDDAVGLPDLPRLAAGGAVAALPTFDSPFLANPAHIAGTRRLALSVAGVTAGAGGNLRETYDFYDRDLGPALDEGLERMRDEDPERLEALYAEALRVGGAQKTLDVAVLAPSVRARVGGVAFGVGLYGHAVTRGQVLGGGAGVPYVDLYSQADVLVPAVVGADLTPFGVPVSVGASATYVQRRLTAKGEALDAFHPDSEKLYVLRGDGLRVGLGVLARDVGVRGLDLGAEVSGLGRAIAYGYERSFAVSGSADDPDDAAEIAALQARFAERAGGAALRVGAAFRLPEGPGVSGAALALDYTSASTAEYDQSVRAGLRGGARATLGGLVEVQAGLSQGMASGGAALVTRFARLAYATYGVEDGRLMGQRRRRAHAVQLRFGLF